MKASTYINEEELLRQGMEALLEKLGPVETGRFLALIPSQRIESVTRHRRWQKTLSKDDFFRQIFTEK